MSDNLLILIPSDPTSIPEPESRRRAMEYLRDRFVNADEVSDTVHAAITFVDCGANLEHILCPACGEDLDIGWWQGRMSDSMQTGFAERQVTTPCCNTQTELNHLKYHWLCGFARYELSVMNPGRDIANDEAQSLEAELGTTLRVIQSHI